MTAPAARTIRIHDTQQRTKLDLSPRTPGQIGMYVCGPTVYDRSHLGHARVYVAFDVVRRHLQARGHAVSYVRNFTDIDDKIIKRANERGLDARALAEENIVLFHQDMGALGVGKGDVEPRVTDHIEEIRGFIARLIERGVAYAAGGDVYFAVDRFATYGALSGKPLDDLRAGARVEPGEKKKNPLDFVLWKGAKPGEPSWESPWGPGRPGWHIECSAMSHKYLGHGFDIHGGGMDLIFPHHENEKAQSEAALEGPFVRHWMHNGFVNLNDQKMSKSLGNVFGIGELLARHSAETLRYFLLTTHYRSPINFEVETRRDAGGTEIPGFPGLDEAEKRVTYGYETLARAEKELASAGLAQGKGGAAGVGELVEPLLSALDDDFNTAVALAELGKLLTQANALLGKPGEAGKLAATVAAVRMAGRVLGLHQQAAAGYLGKAQEEGLATRGLTADQIEALIAARAAARKGKDFKRADEIRQELKAKGVEIMDSPQGTTWKVI
jgi:cysteinyl-tRNA synthetase